MAKGKKRSREEDETSKDKRKKTKKKETPKEEEEEGCSEEIGEKKSLDELLLELETTDSQPLPSLLSAVVKKIKEKGRWGLELEDPMFRAHEAYLIKGGDWEPEAIEEALESSRVICRRYNSDYPPKLDDEVAWRWFCIQAQLKHLSGQLLPAFQDVSLVLQYREQDFSERLRPIVESPEYKKWSTGIPLGFFPWEVDEEGILSMSFPKDNNNNNKTTTPHKHQIGATMEMGSMITAAPHSISSRRYPVVQFQLHKDDLERLTTHLGCQGPCDKPWESVCEDPNDALALLLASLRQKEVEEMHNKLAKAFVVSFAEFKISEILLFPYLWFGQSIVAKGNDGTIAVNTSWLTAFQHSLRLHSEALGLPTITMEFQPGQNPFQEPGVVFKLSRESKVFNLAISGSGKVGSTPVREEEPSSEETTTEKKKEKKGKK